MFVMKFVYNISLTFMISVFLSCFDPGERGGRVNPFDPNGSNWFPPTVTIDKDTIYGTIYDTVAINVKTNDQNGTVNFLVWTSEPELIDIIDTITECNDSIEIKDTAITIISIPVDTIDTYDTSFFDSASSFYKTVEDDYITFIFQIDSVISDTFTFDTAADSSFIYEKEDSSLYLVYLVMESDSIIYKDSSDTTITVDSVYYVYSSKFTFDIAGVYTLFVSAVDNDGVESESKDSVHVIIADTALAGRIYPYSTEFD